MNTTKTLNQKILFNCKPTEFYDTFMNQKKHAALTGGKAIIGQKVGEKFSVFDDYATGENIELILNKKIVQTWRASDWKEGHYSKITLELSKHKNKTLLKFTHEKIPKDKFEEIKQGWIEYYWNPIKKIYKE